MPARKPGEYIRDYIQSCHYKWEFLRRSGQYRKDYVRSKKPLDSKWHDSVLDPEMEHIRSEVYGIIEWWDPKKLDSLNQSDQADPDYILGRYGLSLDNPFHDWLAGARVYPAANAGIHVGVKEGYEHLYRVYVVDMRASLRWLLAECEVLIEDLVPDSKTRQSDDLNSRPLVEIVDPADWEEIANVQGLDWIDDVPHHIGLGMWLYPGVTRDGLMIQVGRVLHAEMAARQKAGERREVLVRRMRFSACKEYLRVWDLRHSRNTWSEIAKTLYPGKWKAGCQVKKERRIYERERLKSNAPIRGRGGFVYLRRNPAVKLVQDQFARAQELMRTGREGYRSLDLVLPPRGHWKKPILAALKRAVKESSRIKD